MSNLSDFAKDYKPKEKILEKEEEVKDTIQERYEHYKDFSQDQLLSELYRQIELQKSRGEFDYNSLKNSVELMSGYLNQEQKQKLLTLLESLK